MNRKVHKKRLLISLILFFLALIYIIRIFEIKIREKNEVTSIFEIKKTQMTYYSQDTKIATLEKNYMIVQPPENLEELKILVRKYNDDNPIDKEFVIEHIKKARNSSSVEIKKINYEIYFYRKSKRLPKDWEPDETYMNTDRIEHHTEDCIAVIRWSDLEPEKAYHIMKKSSDKDNYGSLIEQIR